MPPRRSHRPHCIGFISDTHGLLRPEAVAALRVSDLIIHGGDIGTRAVLQGLRRLAPVVAIRGNNDHGAWAERIPATRTLHFGPIGVHVLHDLKTLKGVDRPCRVIVSGHSHRPSVEERNGVLFVNPGSAGPRRFRLPLCVGQLLIAGDDVSAQLVELTVSTESPSSRRKRASSP